MHLPFESPDLPVSPTPGSFVRVVRPDEREELAFLQSWVDLDNFSLVFTGGTLESDTPAVIVRIQTNTGFGPDSTSAEFQIDLPDQRFQPVAKRTLIECFRWARDNEVTSLHVLCHCADVSAWLEARGLTRLYTYEVWTTNPRQMQARLERARSRNADSGRFGSLVAEACREDYLDGIRQTVAEYDLLSQELVSFGQSGYDRDCSTVVLDGGRVAGTLLTKIGKNGAFDITRAVARPYRDRSGPINLLLIGRTVSKWVDFGISSATFYANCASAQETINMAKRFGGTMVRREFVHVWPVDVEEAEAPL